MPFDKFKGGKLPPVHKPAHLALGDFVDRCIALPKVPAHGWEFAVPADKLSVLGNDVWGNCALAGALGLAQAQSWNVGKNLVPRTEEAVQAYTQVTGFDPNAGPSGNNPTDNGTVLTDALDFWQKTGFAISDSNGKETIHKIDGWFTVDYTSVAMMRWAAWFFGGSYLGVNLPQSAEDDTDNWIFDPNSPTIGGHCVDRLGEGSAGGKTRSWGMIIPTQQAFYSARVDEAYVVMGPDFLNSLDKTPLGVDVNAMVEAAKNYRMSLQ
jgi:hypothetical protein